MALFGTANWTQAGLNRNEELILHTRAPALVDFFARSFEKLWARYEPLRRPIRATTSPKLLTSSNEPVWRAGCSYACNLPIIQFEMLFTILINATQKFNIMAFIVTIVLIFNCIIFIYYYYYYRAVASMGQGGQLPPPHLGRCPPPPIGSCPGHSRKPAFGNGAIASWEMYKN